MRYDTSKFPEGVQSYLRYSKVVDQYRYKKLPAKIENDSVYNTTNQSCIRWEDWDWSEIKELKYLFDEPYVVLTHLNLPELISLDYLFDGTKPQGDVVSFTFKKIQSLRRMGFKANQIKFIDCDWSNLTYIGDFGLNQVAKFDAIDDCSKVTSVGQTFWGAHDTIVDFGGFINLKANWNSLGSPKDCPNLSVESLLNILNGLFDFVSADITPSSSQGKIALGTTNLAKLTDEQKAIATNKGWTLT